MNVLDENIPESQAVQLRKWRIAIRQIGQELGRNGMEDDEILPLLHELDRPTFFTLDGDFFHRNLCHKRYCLIHLEVDEDLAAEHVRRLLRHPELNTRAKRLGSVIRVKPTGFSYWRLHQRQMSQLAWE